MKSPSVLPLKLVSVLSLVPSGSGNLKFALVPQPPPPPTFTGSVTTASLLRPLLFMGALLPLLRSRIMEYTVKLPLGGDGPRFLKSSSDTCTTAMKRVAEDISENTVFLYTCVEMEERYPPLSVDANPPEDSDFMLLSSLSLPFKHVQTLAPPTPHRNLISSSTLFPSPACPNLPYVVWLVSES